MAFMIWALTLFPTGSLEATHSKILTVVPQYAQEAYIWCGPAAAQMTLAGYPGGSCNKLQEDIWLKIQDFKVESVWDTDPVGMEKALEYMDSETPCSYSVNWVVKNKNTAAELMKVVAYWMNYNSFPVTLLLSTDAHNINVPSHQEHWVVVTGIVTDVDPLTNSTVNLEAVLIHDPAFSDIGYPTINRYCTASQWGTLFQAVNKPASTYHGKYVAVVEPPEVTGIAIIPLEILKGVVIKPNEAVRYAEKWLKKYKISDIEGYRLLKGAEPLNPLLVNRKHGGYFIVPYASAAKTDENNPQGNLAGAAVLINAYKGNLKEVGLFQPMKFMGKDKAVQIARNYLNIKSTRKVKAELVTKIKGRSFSRYFPCWKITLDRKLVHVTQKGEIISNELPITPGTRPCRKKWSASIHGGTTFPVTDFGSRYDSSFMFALNLDYHFNKQLSAVALAGFNHFKAASASVSNTHWWNFSANLKWEFSTNSTRPYMNGGFGLYVPKTGTAKPGFNVGVGLDRSLNPNLVLEVGMDYHHILTNQEDPEFYTAHIGLIFRF